MRRVMNHLNAKKAIAIALSEHDRSQEHPLSPPTHPGSSQETTCGPPRRAPKPKDKDKGKRPVTLSAQPHLIASDAQLVRELAGNLPSTSAHTLEHPMLSDLMLALIRALSSTLDTTQRDLSRSRRETHALRTLLLDGYSVGVGEIERCLVRSTVPHEKVHHEHPACAPWTLDLPPTATRSRHSTDQPSALDLDDLREAMNDNPSYDTASLSSSLIPSPSSLLSQAPPQEPKPSATRLKSSTLLPPHTRSSTSKPPKNSDKQKRKDSVGSSSISNNSTGRSTWGFQGWKFTTNKPKSSQPPSTSTFGTDEEEGERSNLATDESSSMIEGSKSDTTDEEEDRPQPGRHDPITNRLFANLFSRRHVHSQSLLYTSLTGFSSCGQVCKFVTASRPSQRH